MLSEKEFLSPYGIRSLSKFHDEKPYRFNFKGTVHEVKYEPGESSSYLFGGNSIGGALFGFLLIFFS